MPPVEGVRAAVFDTHAWVWVAAGDRRARSMASFRGELIVSAISLWEVAMLESKGRLAFKRGLEHWLAENLASPVVLESIHPAIAIESCRLPGFHGDPADRLIVATAVVLGVPLVTADDAIQAWNERHRGLTVIAL